MGGGVGLNSLGREGVLCSDLIVTAGGEANRVKRWWRGAAWVRRGLRMGRVDFMVLEGSLIFVVLFE